MKTLPQPQMRTARTIEARPSVELTGHVPSPAARDLALEIARREVARLRPGMMVIDRLEVAPSASARRSA